MLILVASYLSPIFFVLSLTFTSPKIIKGSKKNMTL